MTTAINNSTDEQKRVPAARPLTVREYHRMGEAGLSCTAGESFSLAAFPDVTINAGDLLPQ
jgi:hypothetical protein